VRALVVVSLAVVALVGCKRANDQFCDAATPCESGTCNLNTNECEVQPADAGLDAAICVGDTECTVPTSPICDDGSGMCRGCATGAECLAKDPAAPECDGSGACVECLTSAMCAAGAPICSDGECDLCADHPECLDRDPATPRCAADGLCVECTDHGDCASGVCDRAAGTCVDAGAVIYVDPAGSDVGGCGDFGAECRTISFALGEAEVGRNTLSVAAGTYNETVLADAVTATIVGPTTALVRPSFSDQAALLMLNNASLTIDGLTFRDAFGDSNADGINCSNSTLVARGTIVASNDASGVDARNGCDVTLESVDVSNNQILGLNIDASAITLHRSTVRNNDGGGFDLADSAFDLVNNFIVTNGDLGSPFGGVRIELDGSEATTVFEFNTVADNNQSSGSGFGRGVHCLSPATVTLANNIVFGGTGGMLIGGTCSWEYSDIQGTPVQAGEGNINDDPMFVDVASDDYHILSGSACKDAADDNAALDIDFDGDERPRGGRRDIGADER